MDATPQSNRDVPAPIPSAATAFAGRKRKEPPPADSEGQAGAAADDSDSHSRSPAAPPLRSPMDVDSHSSSAATAGRVRNEHFEADEQKDAAAASSSAAAASSADSAAKLTADGDSLLPSQSVVAASYSPQQVEHSTSAPVPLSVCVTGIDPPSASVRLAAAAADSATAVSAVTANSAAAVPMLRYICQCRDVQFALMQLLTLADLAALNSTCRSWRQWLLHPPLVSGLRFKYRRSVRRAILLARSAWARQLVTEMRLKSLHSRRAYAKIAPAEWELAACDQFLSALPRFTRLHTLTLKLCDVFAATSLWPSCFMALSDSLRELQLHGQGGRQAALVNAALQHVGRLRRLTALAILMGRRRMARDVNLDQLPSLLCLCKFKLLVEDERRMAEKLWFRCTPTQILSLAQCRTLTSLDCGGIWSPNKRQLGDDGWQLPPAAQQIDEGIAALVRGLTLQTVEAVGAGASASSVAPLAGTASCHLERLNLRGTAMSATVWEHVSRLTELTELWPDYWRSDITPQQWSRLADFKRLHTIHIISHPDDDYSPTPLRTEHFLPPLLRCKQLETVRLLGPALSLSADQLDGIAHLPLLRWLCMHSVEVKSVEPLAHATKLRRLLLVFYRGPPAVVDFRRSLPPLPALTELRLDDRCRITAAQAAPLNAALFARMPKLTPAKFEQNLLD